MTVAEGETQLPPAGGGKPLDGIRVLDFTFQAAGPYATWLLASLGAEVLKVETAGRPDPTRGRENRPYSRSVLFHDVNAGKRSIAINMKTPGARALILRLLEHCDAMVDNLRPGVMARWGIDYADLQSRYPRLVLASLTAAGSSGPLAGLPGYAGIFSALGGLGSLTGYESGPPTELRTSVDMRAGATFAMTIAWALRQAKATGRGRYLDFSAVEAVALLCGEYLTAVDLGAPVEERIGNRDEAWTPHGVYAAADDRWIAITARSDAEWALLAGLLCRSGIAVPDRLQAAASRCAAREEVDRLLGSWLSRLTMREAWDQLRSLDLPAGPVFDATDLFNDEHLRAREFVQPSEPVDGDPRHTILAAPWTVDGHRPGPVGGATPLGVDTDHLLQEVLGLDQATLAVLHQEGVLG